MWTLSGRKAYIDIVIQLKAIRPFELYFSVDDSVSRNRSGRQKRIRKKNTFSRKNKFLPVRRVYCFKLRQEISALASDPNSVGGRVISPTDKPNECR